MASLTTPRVLQVRSLFGALIPYSRGLELQEALAEAVKRHLLPDQLLLLQVAMRSLGLPGSRCGQGPIPMIS